MNDSDCGVTVEIPAARFIMEKVVIPNNTEFRSRAVIKKLKKIDRGFAIRIPYERYRDFAVVTSLHARSQKEGIKIETRTNRDGWLYVFKFGDAPRASEHIEVLKIGEKKGMKLSLFEWGKKK